MTVAHKFFPTQHKALMQFALEFIADPNIKKKLKQTFKNLVTNYLLSTEIRDNKIKAGLSLVAKYLAKKGDIIAANELSAKLKQTPESVVTDALPKRNLPLEYRLANLALNWNKQNRVWPSPVKMLTPQKDRQVNNSLSEFVAPKSLVNNNFTPSFNQQRLRQPLLSEQFTEIALVESSEPIKKLTALKHNLHNSKRNLL